MRVTPAEWDQQGRSVRGLPQSQHRRANVASTEILPLETVKSTAQSYVTFDNRAEELTYWPGYSEPKSKEDDWLLGSEPESPNRLSDPRGLALKDQVRVRFGGLKGLG